MTTLHEKDISPLPPDEPHSLVAKPTIERPPPPPLSLFQKIGCALRSRRLRRYLEHEAEIQLESLLELRLTGQSIEPDLPLAGLVASFDTVEMRNRAAQRGAVFGHAVDRVATNAAANVRERIDLQTDRIGFLSGHLQDVRGAIDPLPDWSEFEIPPPPDSIEDGFEAEERARQGLALERRHTLGIAIRCTLAAVAVGLEFEVLYLTVDGVWGGTSASSSQLVLSMTAALAALMLWLAERMRCAPSWPVRLAAGANLLAIAACLSLFRSGLLMSPDAAVAGVVDLELIAINLVIFLSSVGMSLLGEFAIARALEAIKASREFHDANAPGLARSRARLRSLAARDWFRNAKQELSRKIRTGFERAFPNEIDRTEGQLLREHAATRRILRDELRDARRKLGGEIEAVASQLARWWYEERVR